MKTLRNPVCKHEILLRLGSVGPASPRRWGAMSAHQMICHLRDGFLLYMGERRAAPAKTPYPRMLTKWVALWAPLRWPQARVSDGPGDRSTQRRHTSGGVRLRRATAPRSHRAFYAPPAGLPSHAAPAFWPHVGNRVDATGLSAHRPSPPPVWRVSPLFLSHRTSCSSKSRETPLAVWAEASRGTRGSCRIATESDRLDERTAKRRRKAGRFAE